MAVQSAQSGQKTSGPSRKKLWLFRIAAAVILPAAVLGGLEVSLRLFGVGCPTDTAVLWQRHADRRIYRPNYDFGKRFFPAHIARDFDGFVFDIPKPPRTYRIFILGESAAMGVPEPACNFGRILEMMLNDTYPDVHFEVHNTAMVAINSHAVRRIAADCSRYDPDLFVVYMGNNEVVGPFGPGSVFAPLSPNLSLIDANIALRSLRIGQLLDRTVQAIAPGNSSPHRWGGLEMFVDHPVRHDDPAMQTVYGHFEANLRTICAIAGRCGAKTVVSTVGGNLKDCAPFLSQHRTDMTQTDLQQWQVLYQSGIDAEQAADDAAALDRFSEAATLDPTYAELQYRMARLLERTQHVEKARDHYGKALEYDALRLRADDAINRIIRTVAENRQSEGIYFVDSRKAFADNSPQQLPGRGLFYEHVHLTFEGNCMLAKSFFEAIRHVLPPTLKANEAAEWTAARCAERLVYTDFDRWDNGTQLLTKMLTQPPFTAQLDHDVFLQQTQEQIAALKAHLTPAFLQTVDGRFQAALSADPEDWKLHWRYAVFCRKGLPQPDLEEAHLREALKRCPYLPARLGLGQNLSRQGKLNEACEALFELLKLKPDSAQAHVELAKIYRLRRDNSRFIAHLAKSLELAPAISIEPYGLLADVYEKTGRLDDAVAILYRAVAVFPEDKTAQAHATLGYLLHKQGNFAQALQELQAALRLNPDFANDAMFQSLLNAARASDVP